MTKLFMATWRKRAPVFHSQSHWQAVGIRALLRRCLRQLRWRRGLAAGTRCLGQTWIWHESHDGDELKRPMVKILTLCREWVWPVSRHCRAADRASMAIM